MTLSLFFADLIRWLHYAIVLGMWIPLLAPPSPWMRYVVVLIIGVMMDWNDGDDQCALTALESKLRGKWAPGAAGEKDDAPAFFQPFINSLLSPFGSSITHQAADRLNYLLLLLSLFVALLKLAHLYRIPLRPSTPVGWGFMCLYAVLILIWVVNRILSPKKQLKNQERERQKTKLS